MVTCYQAKGLVTSHSSNAHTNDPSSLTHCMYRLNLQSVPDVITRSLSLFILPLKICKPEIPPL